MRVSHPKVSPEDFPECAGPGHPIFENYVRRKTNPYPWIEQAFKDNNINGIVRMRGDNLCYLSAILHALMTQKGRDHHAFKRLKGAHHVIGLKYDEDMITTAGSIIPQNRYFTRKLLIPDSGDPIAGHGYLSFEAIVNDGYDPFEIERVDPILKYGVYVACAKFLLVALFYWHKFVRKEKEFTDDDLLTLMLGNFLHEPPEYRYLQQGPPSLMLVPIICEMLDISIAVIWCKEREYVGGKIVRYNDDKCKDPPIFLFTEDGSHWDSLCLKV